MHQSRGIRSAIALILAGASIILAGCTSSGGAAGNSAPARPGFVVSYAGAAGWLSGLDSAEAQEQLRDWARLGLASYLGMDTARLRDATYDTLPVRDAGFAGLARQDIGPGRALYDGKGVLHILVPRGDPHEARTIGLLLDQYRADAGTDAPWVQVHHYQINTATDTIGITDDPVEPTAKVRAAYGYVTMPVGTTAELSRFLARASYLSHLELRGSHLWASGWDWPISQSARITMADVSALQRGYVDAHRAGGQLPGFSLDPQRITTAQDLLAVIPGLSQDMANRIITNNWTGSHFRSASDLDQNFVQRVLFGQAPAATLSQYGLPTSRTQLWALNAQLQGLPAYSQARYDGELAGTEVGMTLFYTDYVAKAWVSGVGTGIPSKAATGFVPDTLASTVWSQCDTNSALKGETGRLWFGENDSAVRSDAHGISLGEEPVRLYARTDGPSGSEIEPSYSFGRALLWWDKHYQAVADYDPQYQRLDLIMRWSDAFDWLTSKTAARLPQLRSDQIPSNLTFADWYHSRDQLRERSPIDFVSPSAAHHRSGTWPTSYGESIAHQVSKVFMDCGLAEIEGGVSLGNASERQGGANYSPNLPISVDRAGAYDHASTFNEKTGTGEITQVSLDDSSKITSFLERKFSTSHGAAVVGVTGSGRRVAPFGGLKVWRAETALRTLQLRISANPGGISEQVALQGQDLGGLEVRYGAGLATIGWRSGLLSRVQATLESVQNKLTARPTAGLAAAIGGVQADNVLYEYQAPDGQVLYRMGYSGDPWLSITGRGPPPGDNLVLRGGAPNPGGNGPVFFYGEFARGPDQRDGWLDVTPTVGGQPAVIRLRGPPPTPGDPSVTVTTPDGKATTVYEHNGHLLVRADDPILGLHGLPEGAAMLRDFSKIKSAMSAAAQARDGFLRGVVLAGDGVALADADTVMVVPPDHPWADLVYSAVGSHASYTPLILHEHDQALLVDKSKLTPVKGSQWTSVSFGAVLKMDDPVYVNDAAYRSTLAFDYGRIIASVLPLTTRVIVREFAVTGSVLAVRPDVQVYNGARWVRVSATTSGSSSAGSPPPSLTPSPTPGQFVWPPVSGARVLLLVCPASAPDHDRHARPRDHDHDADDVTGCGP